MFVKDKKTKRKGSVLVFSMIMLSLILTSALAIGAATIIERKNSLASNRSTQGFQVADTGIEMITKKIREAAASQSIAVATGKTCNGSNNAYVSDSTIGSTNIYFFTDPDALNPASCTVNTAGDIRSLKAVGTYSTTTRAVKAPAINHQSAILTTPGLVSYWKMDNDWTDSVVANNNGGTATAGAGFDSVNKKFGSWSGSFNGSGDVTISNTRWPASMNRGTIEMWLRPNFSMNGGSIQYAPIYFNQFGAANSAGFVFRQSSDDIIFYIHDGAGAYPANYHGAEYDNVDWNSGDWKQLVATWDGAVGASCSVKIYVNGALVGGPDCTPNYTNFTFVPNTSTWRIGSQGGSDKWNGQIDEVAIYDRELSQVEIQSHR